MLDEGKRQQVMGYCRDDWNAKRIQPVTGVPAFSSSFSWRLTAGIRNTGLC